VPEAAMQQDYGMAEPIARVPDPSAVVFHVALNIRRRQGRSALRFEHLQIVILSFHEP
jgi:hypothetical protein